MNSTGHWTGPEELQDVLPFVVVTEDDQRLMLTPDPFEKQFGWKNEQGKLAQ